MYNISLPSLSLLLPLSLLFVLFLWRAPTNTIHWRLFSPSFSFLSFSSFPTTPSSCCFFLRLESPFPTPTLPRNMTAHSHAHDTPGAGTKEMEDRRVVSQDSSWEPQGFPTQAHEHQRGSEEDTSRPALGSFCPCQWTTSALQPSPGTFPYGFLRCWDFKNSGYFSEFLNKLLWSWENSVKPNHEFLKRRDYVQNSVVLARKRCQHYAW